MSNYLSTKYTERDGAPWCTTWPALRYLHALSIGSNRDIKPENLLVRGPCLSVPTLASPPLKWQKSHADSLVQTVTFYTNPAGKAKRI